MKLIPAAIPAVLLAACASTAPLTPEQAFKRADADGDGLLARNEATDIMIATRFKALDSNGDGKVSEAEFIAGGGTAEKFKALDPAGAGEVSLAEAQSNPAAVEHMAVPFDEADVNKNGSITLDEFLAYQASVDAAVR
ncbi:EF-hand domain-containing protein [Haloferula sp. A504]|uniref:EF-hand domain-containing protein n=1 Tax=Haloferula sp. A504 TaxID=3373601 RepID=UPI0031CA6762|nr:EF-hand domain-containing protein [Verrucomicrobiaceae bacterium E54]